MSTTINLEIIRNLPFSNANRDDAGQPKTVRVGGTTRGRLSSQSLKRHARFWQADKTTGYGLDGDNSGSGFYRTRYVPQLIEQAVIAKGGDDEAIKRVPLIYKTKNAKGTAKLGALKSNSDKADKIEKNDTLIVLTKEEIEKIADMVIADEISELKITEILQKSHKRDIALYGRFFASGDDLTIDGSAQVAHAFTTHAVSIEDDFFVGLDDASNQFSFHAGAGQPGDSFYLTGTFYQYANFNLEETVAILLNTRIANGKVENLLPLTLQEVQTEVNYITRNFVESFTKSVPQGKIRSTAHLSLPSYIRVTVRNDIPITGASAFNTAIKDRGSDITKESIKKLTEEHQTQLKIVPKAETELVLDLTGTVESNVDNLEELISILTESLTEKISSAYSILNTTKE